MITYIVYRETKGYRLSDYLFLFRSFAENGQVRYSKQPENMDGIVTLRNEIDSFLSQHISYEWQLVFIDGEKAFNMENPYEEDMEYLENIRKLFEISKEDSKERSSYERNLNAYPPRNVYLLRIRNGIYFQNKKTHEDLYKSFADQYPSNYRFLTIDLMEEEDDLNDFVMFRVMCSALILTINEWSNAIMEQGHLYKMNWEIDYRKAEKYLNEWAENRKQIERKYKQYSAENWKEFHGEKIGELPKLHEQLIGIEHNNHLIPFWKGRFLLFASDDETDMFLWKMNNDTAIARIKSLDEFPIGRWENEINENKKNMIPEFGMENFQLKYLSKTAQQELHKIKKDCTQEIFRINVDGRKLRHQLKATIENEEKVEKSISERLTLISFFKSAAQIIAGKILLALLYFILLMKMVDSSKDNIFEKDYYFILVLYFVLSIIFFFYQFYLYSERSIKIKKLYKSYKEVEKCLVEDDVNYNVLLGKIILHQKYSLLEQQQKKLNEKMIRNQILLDGHKKLLVLSEQNARKLSWVLGIKPMPVNEKERGNTIVDFTQEPKECMYYYSPYKMTLISFVIEKLGMKIYLPFPFINRFSINKISVSYTNK